MRQLSLLVYPHTMEIGGSQLNAIELAAAVRDRGHRVAVYAADGPLVEHVRDLGLDYVPARGSRFRPGVETAADLVRVSRLRSVDVLHGYEWPPILEAYAASWALTGGTVAVGTVMSMGVAPFIPSSVPLAVGTARIRDRVSPVRRGPVELLEPPVDTRSNSPDYRPGFEPPLSAAEPGTQHVVVVSRLVRELKLEGILTAVRAVGRLARFRPLRLLVVGDGSAYAEVAAAAAEVNGALGKVAVVLTGEVPDPRWAYQLADVCLGMGGSALRSLAFGKPLVVQGESGFFETLTPETVDVFLEQGWYGVAGLDTAAAEDRLVSLLCPLLDDTARREALGRFGRRLVLDRFSLEGAAAKQEAIYRSALERRASFPAQVVDSARSGVGLVGHKVRRRIDRIRGQLAVDDFNARPL